VPAYAQSITRRIDGQVIQRLAAFVDDQWLLARCPSTAVSSDVDQQSRVLRRNEKEGSRSAGRLPATLLPFLECADGHTQELSESGLREARAFADAGDGRHMHDSAVLSAFELSETFQDFEPDLALSLSH
jgi:hypothetical protein